VQALILAAGEGSRLVDPLERPKCLREVGDAPLVHHQLAALAAADVLDVLIVVGYKQALVKDSVGSWARFVTSDRYAETNSMYSFLLGERALHDDLVVMNSDVFCDPRMLQVLLAAEGDALLFDSSSGDEDEQMKVQARAGVLVEMSKTLPSGSVSGENVGILKLTRETAEATAAAAAALIASGQERAWLAEAINLVADEHPIECIDVEGWPWIEIDFPEDLTRARQEVFPRVVAANAPFATDRDESLARALWRAS
jgi:L-glutamine-phosphate cytidylyltransferase